MCIGAPGIARSDRRRFAASLLDALLGGSASSRLFQEIREKRGMAYAVYTFGAQYTDTGLIGFYVGTREENLADCLEIAIGEIADVAAGDVRETELERAKENLKGRILLSMEATSNRMSRLGKSLITDTELLSIDRIAAEIDAVPAEAVAELAGILLAPEKLSAAGIGPSEERFRAGAEADRPDAGLSGRSGVKVALVGYQGKVGRVLQPALEDAGHEVTPIGREDPIQIEGHDAAVNFTRPDVVFVTVSGASSRASRTSSEQRGSAGKSSTALGDLAREQGVQLFVAPNFAVGAVLMMRFAAEAATRTAALRDHRAAPRDRRTTPPRARRRRQPSCWSATPPIHSVRLPGLVAHQEVLFGEPGALLTIRHDAYLARGVRPGGAARLWSGYPASSPG